MKTKPARAVCAARSSHLNVAVLRLLFVDGRIRMIQNEGQVCVAAVQNYPSKTLTKQFAICGRSVDQARCLQTIDYKRLITKDCLQTIAYKRLSTND